MSNLLKQGAIFFLFMIGLCVACGPGGKVFTKDGFFDVSLGTSGQELEKLLGKPYAVCLLNAEEKEYKYVEKVAIADRVYEVNTYYLVLKEGRVASKRVETQKLPAYELDSYDLQTSYQQEEGSLLVPKSNRP